MAMQTEHHPQTKLIHELIGLVTGRSADEGAPLEDTSVDLRHALDEVGLVRLQRLSYQVRVQTSESVCVQQLACTYACVMYAGSQLMQIRMHNLSGWKTRV